MAEMRPRRPGCIGSPGLSSRDCIFGSLFDSQKLGLEAQCSGGVANFQGCWEGAMAWIFSNNSASERVKERDNKSESEFVTPGM
jgi:hypothetical protein